MQKFTRIIAIFLTVLTLSSQCVFAKYVGEKVGDVYPTDIKTYIFDQQINSYNIGGKTVIIAEDLGWYYGFYVEWNGEYRTLTMTDEIKETGFIENINEKEQRDISQRIANRPKDYFNKPVPNHIYYTDIVTTLEGKEIQSYNLNGETAIVVEDLKNFGYDVIWDESKRTLNVYEKFENHPVSTDIGNAFEWEYLSQYTLTCLKNTLCKAQLKSGDGKLDIDSFINISWNYDSAVPIKETFDFHGIAYSFEDNILKIDASNAKKFEFSADTQSKDETFFDGKDVSYIYAKNAVINGAETEITYSAITGHFDMMRKVKIKTNILRCGSKAYIPLSFLRDICGIENN